jgi:cilia- and flagella-associated protein 52
VLWDVATGTAICGSPASNNFSLCVEFYKNRNDALVTAGNYNLLMWQYDKPNNKLRSQDAQLGQLQRIFKSLTIDIQDKYVYAGTTSGDILQV